MFSIVRANATRLRIGSVRYSSSFASRAYPGLYLHPQPSKAPPSTTAAKPTYALSFLPTPAPSSSFSPTTIGLLSSSAPTTTRGEPEILPRYFQENPQFLDLVHEVLRDNIEHDLWVQSLAKSVVSSSLEGGVDTYIHLGDQRNPAEAQRTAQPQDILASFLVRGKTGEIVAGSYERNKVAYRLVSELGLMQLPPSLFEKLVEACERVREVELEVAKERGEA
ncbi:uncharacterized protein JCM15063_004283 [Sporobolomyces koalae]|uniref:uncharacterized protein n=1 Tax=Sporobolomyces koalae TaxID=500713 RepID=UPI00317F0FC5